MVRRRRLKVLLWTVCILLISAGPLMAYGPLVPWSPIHPGYSELRLERARVLYPSDRTMPDAYRHIDQWIAEGEAFHSLRVGTRITVVLCRNWSDFHRFAPWITGRNVAGLSLATGDAVYITPKVDEKRLDHGEFVRHELSHSILAQHTSVYRTHTATKRYPWFHEGLAVWFGRQRAFMSQAEFFEQAPALGVSKALRDGSRGPELRFSYIAWRNFLDYLDQRYGHERLVAFVHDANKRPDEMLALFQSTFQVSWDEAVNQFEAAVLMHTFMPRP